jgi:hypothetical protein
MNWKIIMIILVVFLVIGQSCELPEDSEEGEKESNTFDPDDEFYDGLDDALDELEELEGI